MLRRRLQRDGQLHKVTLWTTNSFDRCRELLGNSFDEFGTKAGAPLIRRGTLPGVADRQNETFS
jgi:hypothetical protein